MIRQPPRIVYHPQSEPPAGIPLFCRSVGTNFLRRGEYGHFTAKPHWSLLWTVRGEGELRLRKRVQRLRCGQGVLIAEGVRRQVACPSEAFSFHSASVIGPFMPQLAAFLGYRKPDVLSPGPCPENDFRLLEESVGDISEAGIRQASTLIYQILLKLFSRSGHGVEDERTVVRRAANLIDGSLSDPDLNVAALSRRLRLHRSQFSRLFRDAFGIPPSEYIIQRRLQRSMSDLRASNRTIAEIAARSGFESPDYFSRLFRKRTGTTPTAFRRES